MKTMLHRIFNFGPALRMATPNLARSEKMTHPEWGAFLVYTVLEPSPASWCCSSERRRAARRLATYTNTVRVPQKCLTDGDVQCVVETNGCVMFDVTPTNLTQRQ